MDGVPPLDPRIAFAVPPGYSQIIRCLLVCHDLASLDILREGCCESISSLVPPWICATMLDGYTADHVHPTAGHPLRRLSVLRKARL